MSPNCSCDTPGNAPYAEAHVSAKVVQARWRAMQVAKGREEMKSLVVLCHRCGTALKRTHVQGFMKCDDCQRVVPRVSA